MSVKRTSMLTIICQIFRVHDLIDLSCMELAKIEGHDAEILALSFTRPDSYWHYLVSASRDRLMHVFDIRRDYELVQTISDHSAIVTSVKFVGESVRDKINIIEMRMHFWL